jgi:hypothetical protein
MDSIWLHGLQPPSHAGSQTASHACVTGGVNVLLVCRSTARSCLEPSRTTHPAPRAHAYIAGPSRKPTRTPPDSHKRCNAVPLKPARTLCTDYSSSKASASITACRAFTSASHSACLATCASRRACLRVWISAAACRSATRWSASDIAT